MSDVPNPLAAALADRYRLERELGQGGMATVYLAEDLKQHRRVAVKVLRADLAQSLGAERFLREIEIAANLHHPHILPLFESGSRDGFLYYVMPMVEGESLRDRLTREKQLPVGDAIRITREVAGALGYAHTKGVVHRDIKPENILLESEHAVVTDFGIARAINSAAGGQVTLTDAGLAVGTPGYMSPEQASGEKDLDGRSDIYSLACVLFEMLAGQPPFGGATAQVVIRQHLTVTAPPITQFRPAVPVAVAEALSRALAKDPADRFNPVGQFAAALEGSGGPSGDSAGIIPTASRPRRSLPWVIATAAMVALIGLGLSTRQPRRLPADGPEASRSIAVLPFVNFGGDSAGEYFSQGISEEILNALAQIPDLRVAARTSSFQFKGKGVDIRDVGRELDVTTVLEGSVQRSGDAVRITTQLIDARTGYHLWSGKFDRPTANLFAVEDEISRAIADTLKISLGLTPRRATGANDPAALDLYFRGLALIPLRGRSLLAAVASFDSALSRDSTLAPAWAGLAFAQELLPSYYLAPFGSSMEAARRAAEHAIALDGNSSRAYLALANVHRNLGEWADAERAYHRALKLGPNDPEAIEQFGQFFLLSGQIPQSLEWLSRARRLDPLAPVPTGVEGVALTHLRQYDSAAILLDRTIALGPALPIGPLWSMWNELLAGRYEAAERRGRQGATAAGLDPETYTFAIRAVADPKLRPAALARLAQIPDTAPWEFNRNVRMDWLALLGDTLGTLKILERGPPAGAVYFNTAIWSPALDPIRNHPRYLAALRKLGLPYESPATP